MLALARVWFLGVVILGFTAGSVRADLLDDLQGKQLKCQNTDGSVNEEMGSDLFFFSKSHKLLWNATLLTAGTGTTVSLIAPSLSRRGENTFAVTAQNFYEHMATLVFSRSGHNVRVTRTDKDSSNRPLSAEICSVSGGIEKVKKQQKSATFELYCGYGPEVSCRNMIIHLCGKDPTIKCAEKNKIKINNSLENP